MKSLRYIRDLMLGRPANAQTGEEPEAAAGHDWTGDGDRRRFRRMAENRKRQILERMLLDDGPVPAPVPIPVEIRRGLSR